MIGGEEGVLVLEVELDFLLFVWSCKEWLVKCRYGGDVLFRDCVGEFYRGVLIYSGKRFKWDD